MPSHSITSFCNTEPCVYFKLFKSMDICMYLRLTLHVFLGVGTWYYFILSDRFISFASHGDQVLSYHGHSICSWTMYRWYYLPFAGHLVQVLWSSTLSLDEFRQGARGMHTIYMWPLQKLSAKCWIINKKSRYEKWKWKVKFMTLSKMMLL